MREQPSTGAWLNLIPVMNLGHRAWLLYQTSLDQKKANAAHQQKSGAPYYSPRKHGHEFLFARYFNDYNEEKGPIYNAALRADIAHYEARNNFWTSAGGTAVAVGVARLGEALAQARHPHAVAGAVIVASAAAISVVTGAFSAEQFADASWHASRVIPEKIWSLPFIRSYNNEKAVPSPVQSLNLNR